MKVEIGPGSNPAPGFDYYVDVVENPRANVRASMECLPFEAGAVEHLQARHVLEHQSYLYILPTLLEWYRVLKPGGTLFVAVPNAPSYFGEQDMQALNHYTMGSLQPIGYDEYDKPAWWWQAHHTLFDWPMLRALLELAGFHVQRVEVSGQIVVEAVKR